MRKTRHEEKEITVYRWNEHADTAKWILNKMKGKIEKQSSWLSSSITDYERINSYSRLCEWITILDKAPNAELYSMGHYFKAYCIRI